MASTNSLMVSPACGTDDGRTEDPVAAARGDHLDEAAGLAIGDGAVVLSECRRLVISISRPAARASASVRPTRATSGSV